MEKITVKIDDELLKKMNERIAKRGCKTMSQCARELIELGLKIEEAAALQDEKNAENGLDPRYMDMIKTSMEWVLESLILTRYLMLKETESEKRSPSDFLKQAKQSAKEHIKNLMGNYQNDFVEGSSE